jgi:hypothetical protein
MRLILKAFSITGLASVYLMQGACTHTTGGNGISFLPTFPGIEDFTGIFGSLPGLG